MRIALCMYGQPRFIKNPYTWLSHKHWFLEKYKVDVYIHSWISGENKKFEFSDWIKNKPEAYENANAANIILNRYKPINYIFESPKNFSLDDSIKDILKNRKEEYLKSWNGDFNWSDNNENNTLSHLYSLSKCLELLIDEYDWVILSRFDNYIYNFPNLYLLNSDNLYLNNKYLYNFSDVLIFGGQSHVKSLKCYDLISELSNNINYFSPEEFKRVAYQKAFPTEYIQGDYGYIPGREKRISIGVAIVRSDTLDGLQS